MSLATSTSVPTLLFAAFVTVVLVGCDVSIDLGGDSARRTDEQIVPADGIRVVDIDNDTGAVEVRGRAVDEITIESTVRERRGGDADIAIETHDDRLVISGECEERWWSDCSIGFVVTLPEELDVRVTMDNGGVGAEAIGGELTMETGNGSIDATALGGVSASADSHNGGVELSFDTAPESVRAISGNGSITVLLPVDDLPYDVDAESANGGVAVGVDTDPSATRHVVARSGNGSIDIGHRTP